MSVALIITVAKSGTKEYVPVAAERIYEQVWVPAAKSSGLTWMQRFHGGAFVPLADLPEVVREFEAMRFHFANSGDEFNARRATNALDALQRVIRSGDIAEVSIG